MRITYFTMLAFRFHAASQKFCKHTKNVFAFFAVASSRKFRPHSFQDLPTDCDFTDPLILMLSAKQNESIREKYLMTDPEDFLIKPVPLDAYVPPKNVEALSGIATLLEEVGRGPEMLVCAISLLKVAPGLSLKEVELLCAAFKLNVDSHRGALRLLRVDGTSDESYLNDVKSDSERDIRAICEDAIKLLPPILERLRIPEIDAASHVLLHTMIGDYHRYLCDSNDAAPDTVPRNQAECSYKTAARLADEWLPAAHPLRLGVALNRSIFYYEVMKSPEQGVDIAKQAFVEANVIIDALVPNERVHAQAVLDRLRENVSLWTDEEDDHQPTK